MGPGSLAFVPRENGRMHLNAFAVLPAGIVTQTWSWLLAEEPTAHRKGSRLASQPDKYVVCEVVSNGRLHLNPIAV